MTCMYLLVFSFVFKCSWAPAEYSVNNWIKGFLFDQILLILRAKRKQNPNFHQKVLEITSTYDNILAKRSSPQ